MSKFTVEEISKELIKMIDNKVSIIENNDQKFKTHYESVMDELESELKFTSELIEDFKEGGLTINAVEQEGYLRCLKTMVNRFRDWEKF